MKATRTPIEIPTTSLTTVSGSFTAISAPSADVSSVITPSGPSRCQRSTPARANRAVADTVMKITANMFVATACRGGIPIVIISGTLISELPPVMAPIAPVTSIIRVKSAICVVVMRVSSDPDGHAVFARVGAAPVDVPHLLHDLRAAEQDRRRVGEHRVAALGQRRRE